MTIRDRYEDQVRIHYDRTGEHLQIAEQRNANPVVVKPESEGFGKVVKSWEREVKVPRWI